MAWCVLATIYSRCLTKFATSTKDGRFLFFYSVLLAVCWLRWSYVLATDACTQRITHLLCAFSLPICPTLSRVLKTKIEKEDTKREILGNQTSVTESLCIRCLQPFKFLVNSKRQCLDCQLYICKSCSRYNKKEHGWVCDPCRMARWENDSLPAVIQTTVWALAERMLKEYSAQLVWASLKMKTQCCLYIHRLFESVVSWWPLGADLIFHHDVTLKMVASNRKPVQHFVYGWHTWFSSFVSWIPV